jgi:hypothetical protein
MLTNDISPLLMENIDAGYDWLEENHPGWQQYIKLDTLDISDSIQCILGQIVNGKYPEDGFADEAYYAAFRLLTIPTAAPYHHDWARAHGFLTDWALGSEADHTAGWRKKFIEEDNKL